MGPIKQINADATWWPGEQTSPLPDGGTANQILALDDDLNPTWIDDVVAGGDITAVGDITAGVDVNATEDVNVGVDLSVGGDAAIDGSVTAATANVGGVANYVAIDADGHVTLEGDATVWDDLRVPVTATQGGGVNDPDFVQVATDGSGSTGVFAYGFDQTTEEELFFTVQLPHTWKEGSIIHPHVHWVASDASAGNVVWGLEYTWANIDQVLGNTVLDPITAAAPEVANQITVNDFTPIDGTGKTASSMLLCRVYRQAAVDTYAADAILLEIDFHYEIDKLGDNALP